MSNTNNRLDQLRQQLEAETIQEKKSDLREATLKDKEQRSDAQVDAKLDQRNQLRNDDIRRDQQRRDDKFYDDKRRDQQARHEDRRREANAAPSELHETRASDRPIEREQVEEAALSQESAQTRDLAKTSLETRREASHDVPLDSSIRSHSDYYKFERAGVPQDGVALNPSSTQRDLSDEPVQEVAAGPRSKVVDRRIDDIIEKQDREMESERANGPVLPPEASRKKGSEIEAKLNAREQSMTLQKEATHGPEQSQSGPAPKSEGPVQETQQAASIPVSAPEPQPQHPGRSM